MTNLAVRKIIAFTLNVETVFPYQDLSADLEATSLHRGDIALQIQKELGATLSDEEMDTCRTVADVCKIVRQRQIEL